MRRQNLVTLTGLCVQPRFDYRIRSRFFFKSQRLCSLSCRRIVNVRLRKLVFCDNQRKPCNANFYFVLAAAQLT